MTASIELNDRETATVLAALRVFQCLAEASKPGFAKDVTFNASCLESMDQFEDGRLAPLTAEEIDSVCERINAPDGSAVNTDTPSALALREAFCAGKTWVDGLRPGDLFLGALPASERYSDIHLLRRLFFVAAMDELEGRIIVTDLNGLLVSVGRKS